MNVFILRCLTEGEHDSPIVGVYSTRENAVTAKLDIVHNFGGDPDAHHLDEEGKRELRDSLEEEYEIEERVLDQ